MEYPHLEKNTYNIYEKQFIILFILCEIFIFFLVIN